LSKRVAIVGASGFVGQHLIDCLSKDDTVSLIRGLSRSQQPSQAPKFESVFCDLFSMKDIENGLEGIDEAIYLVHSMLPSSELAQGNFEDYDLILADNFARACVKHGVRRVLYLSGIIPKHLEANPKLLSQHLRSRLEVETVFKAYGLRLLSLRAGVVMGLGGSSFEMILRLVDRLPAMICPSWTQARSNPIHVNDVCESFRFALANSDLTGVYDLAGPEVLTYLEMIQRCAKHFSRDPLLIRFPVFSPKLSRLWVSTITGAPTNLVYPLIESLKHELLADTDKLFVVPGWRYRTFSDTLNEVSDLKKEKHPEPKAYSKTLLNERKQIVQSVQRIPLPPGFDAERAAQAYTNFLGEYFKGVIVVETVGLISTFYLRVPRQSLLVLEYSVDRSTPNRVLFYIKGGVLDEGNHRARLEFRLCKHEQSLIVAIHDFRPSLPWYIYKYTQALMHLRVMSAFGAYLKRLG
jgi:nucleoside-diphosphate-sugar epimerase